MTNKSSATWGALGTRWVVETSSGSCHLFSFGEGDTYMRVPDATNSEPHSKDPDAYWSDTLRRDGEVLPVIGNLPEPITGERYRFWITGLNPAAVGTLRDTTPVVSVSLLGDPSLSVAAIEETR
ncbi:hypothetical protein [Nocardioides sp.]|uniref:hypothetical protein n=1 Tax=Nocardioides sp. TaxID=35761 RepID=UPI00286D1E47|nr:hypothetical protein [Nocardioides sp.]